MTAPEPLVEWRENRDPGWHKDYGYRLQDVVRRHRYDYAAKGSKPDDSGWHVCSCGTWEGYWSGFEPHVADHLRAVVEQAVAEAKAEALWETTNAWQWGEWTVLTAPTKAETQPQRIIGAAQAVTDWLRERAKAVATTCPDRGATGSRSAAGVDSGVPGPPEDGESL